MQRKLLTLAILLSLSGCISFGGDPAPQKTTIVVPQGSSVTCTNQDGTACQPQ